MSKPTAKIDHGAHPPAWINIAAVAGLLLFITAGFFLLRHFSVDRSSPSPSAGTPNSPAPAASQDRSDSRLIRPGEQPGRIVFADPDVTDADEFRMLAERAPKSAAQIVARMADSPIRDERMYDLMQIWVNKDATQAADWVSGLPHSGMKDDATTELGLAWGSSDPEAAARWVDENIFTENAPAGAASLTSAWVKVDVDAATEWVESLDIDAPARDEALKALAFHLGELDATRGLAWLARLKPKDRNLIVVNFAAAWSGLRSPGSGQLDPLPVRQHRSAHPRPGDPSRHPQLGGQRIGSSQRLRLDRQPIRR